MDEERFEQLIEAYGGESARWPQAERAPALRACASLPPTTATPPRPRSARRSMARRGPCRRSMRGGADEPARALDRPGAVAGGQRLRRRGGRGPDLRPRLSSAV